MAGVNNIILLGRLTRDVEIKTSSNDKSYAKFGLAVGRWNGTEEVPDFFDVTVFGKMADSKVMTEILKKGSEVHIQGQMRWSQYEDKETGKKMTSYTVVPVPGGITLTGGSSRSEGGSESRSGGSSGGGYGKSYDRDDSRREDSRRDDDRSRSRDRDDRNRRDDRDDRPRRSTRDDDDIPF